MIMVPLVKPPDLHIVEWFSQQWQVDMKIKTTERTYETGPSVSDEMRGPFAAVHELGYGFVFRRHRRRDLLATSITG
jgi:hypothetical protein